MNIAGLLFLILTQFIVGRGLIQLLKLQMRPVFLVCFSMLSGVALFSFLPFILELLHISITTGSVGASIGVLTLGFAIPLIGVVKNFKFPGFKDFKAPAIYEYPFLVIFGLLMFLSIWRNFFYPPKARDMLSGPEVMAELALKEKHIINSLFTIDLQSTNNYLKPPFITSLQIIYKMFVQPFGQTWLSIIFVNFIVIAYTLLKEKLHPILACFALLYFFAMPEVFGYSYLMLFDYSNMVYLFCGFYFLNQHFETKRVNEFGFAVFFFAIATYVRTETLILVGMTIPLILFNNYKDKLPLVKSLMRVGLLMLVPFIVYFVCMNIFVKYFIPIHYDVSADINKNLGDVSFFLNRLSDISSKLIFDDIGKIYYGYFVYMFLIVFIADLIFFRKYSKEAVTMMYGIVLVYVGLAFISYLLPLADLMHTTKRGLFKMFPLMLLYYRNSGLLLKITEVINKWEMGISSGPSGPSRVSTQTARPAAAAVPGRKK